MVYIWTWGWEVDGISAAYRVRGYHTDIEQSILSELRAKHYEIALLVAGVALNSGERLASNTEMLAPILGSSWSEYALLLDGYNIQSVT